MTLQGPIDIGHGGLLHPVWPATPRESQKPDKVSRVPPLHPAQSRSGDYLKIPVLRTGASGLDGNIRLLRVRFYEAGQGGWEPRSQAANSLFPAPLRRSLLRYCGRSLGATAGRDRANGEMGRPLRQKQVGEITAGQPFCAIILPSARSRGPPCCQDLGRPWSRPPTLRFMTQRSPSGPAA